MATAVTLDDLPTDAAMHILRLASLEGRGMLATASRRWRALALTPELWPRTVEGVRSRVNHEALTALQRRADTLGVLFQSLLAAPDAAEHLGQLLRLPASVLGPSLIDEALRFFDTRRRVQDAVRKVISEDVAGDEALLDAGLDSSSVTELMSVLEASFGVQLPSMLLFNYPSTDAIVSYIDQLILEGEFPTMWAAAGGANPIHTRRRVQKAVRKVFGHDVAGDAPLLEAGLDSLSISELMSMLEVRFGVQLPTTLVLDYPSIDAIAMYIDLVLEEEFQTMQAAAGGANLE